MEHKRDTGAVSCIAGLLVGTLFSDIVPLGALKAPWALIYLQKATILDIFNIVMNIKLKIKYFEFRCNLISNSEEVKYANYPEIQID